MRRCSPPPEHLWKPLDGRADIEFWTDRLFIAVYDQSEEPFYRAIDRRS
jgi:hypothetical protein